MSESNPVYQTVEILGTPRKCLVRERKARGSDAVVQHLIPLFEETESIVEFLTNLFGGSAEKVRNVIIRDVITPAAVEATSAATDAEGNFSSLKYTEALASWGEPASRRSGGPSLSDLRSRLEDINPRFLQLVGLMRKSNPMEFATTPEGLEFARIYTEMEQINAAIAAKEGAPKKPRKPRAKKEKVATPAEAPAVVG